MIFVGIDLAWSEKNLSCVSIFHEEKFVEYKFLRTNEEIIDHVEKFGGGKVVAIDAPLIVKNKSGLRVCEKELIKFF